MENKEIENKDTEKEKNIPAFLSWWQGGIRYADNIDENGVKLNLPFTQNALYGDEIWKQLYDGIKIKHISPYEIFGPTIRLASWCGKCFSAICSCASLSSKSRDRDEILDLFRARKMDVLFATTVLERGITIPDVQVAVLYSEHAVFTAASLIQMIGRTGRKKEHPDGKGLFLCRYETKQQKQCLKELEKMNASLKSGDHHETL